MGLLEEIAASLQALVSRVDALAGEVAELRAKIQPSREIWTLKNLADLPESPSYKTLLNNPSRQPRGGIPDGYRGSARCWYASTVQAWRRELAPAPSGGELRLARGA